MARHWFHGRFQASALPLVKLWAVLRSVRLPEGPGSLARHWIRSGSRLPFGPHFLHPNQGVAEAQIPPRTAGGLGRGGPRWLAISFALRAAEIEIPPGGQGGTWGDWSPREGRPAPKGRAFRRRPSAPGGSGLARRLFRGRFQASAAPWLGWLLPREAGLRRQGRHPCKANTERRSGRGTRAGGVIPSRFCCPAAIKYPAGAVSSHWFESLAVVPPAAFGGGGNGSGTKRRLVLAVGFQGVYPLVALWLLSGNSESSISGVARGAEHK